MADHANRTDIVAAVKDREKDLVLSINDEFHKHCAEGSEFAEKIRAVMQARAEDIALRHLHDCALVTDEGCIHIAPSQLAARAGRFRYYRSGFETTSLDDFGTRGPRLLVGAQGSVSTSVGKLVVIPAREDRFAVSPAFHIVETASEDFDYIYYALASFDAGRIARGSHAARFIEREDLSSVVIPWPAQPIRSLFAETMKLCERYNHPALTHMVGEYWMLATRSIENLERIECNKNKPEPPHRSIDNIGSNDAILSLIDGLLEALLDQTGVPDKSVLDVVAATPDLSSPAIPAQSAVCLCLPEPNQGTWTKTPPNPDDTRWKLGAPPRNKANFAWVQQTIACMSKNAHALLLLCNAPLHSLIGRELHLRTALAASGLVEAVISLPGGLLDDGRPPSSIVLLAKARKRNAPTLFIDAQEIGIELCRDHSGTPVRTLGDSAIRHIVDTYRRWTVDTTFICEPGFSASVQPEDIERCGGILTAWTYTQEQLADDVSHREQLGR
ncbi:N-6 DNA methylase [Raoultibacter massiliensis]|uniref:N-6 DNA methylase n=1 Tax=Raoultibacter massiliensis TaxID=1852371 RepID=UPI003A8CC2DF